jgi:hypothetical protein
MINKRRSIYMEEKEVKKNRKKEKNEKSLSSRILNIVLWLVLFAWMALVLVDFFKTREEKDPVFCWFNNKTTEYSNGTVTECMGLGYKVINYNREDFKAIEFGPFWIQDRTADEE